ncbi:proteasome accessory factor PafA2 family protein [Buchananella hordeovulneris]|uniref:proteasome accessory factor PafA2 family protein n=1 Tax=Buchananella hordeovulneris TaxID=52770 RepID=UPI000F60240A|nr:proteasome accessory factor PafA2 family protein [Buchananella hordeovulneris]RRD45497.1 proteasome accessory factor PafA2 [Buchananella hordeovulneris]
MRILSTETEYGIIQEGNPRAQAQTLASNIVAAYAATLPVPPVRWDYAGEDPLNDLRGHRLPRAAAHPSQLTDAPRSHLPAPVPAPNLPPSGTGEAGAAALPALPRPSSAELSLATPTNCVTLAGARFYVDHAHPEYSAGEAASVRDAVLADRAGDVVAAQAMAALGDGTVLFKNNTDGKGAAYGAHENYQVSRATDLDDIIAVLLPFLVTRPILCGTGRLGRGQRSEQPGFQISQRADFIENDIGLETTFNRPIVNMRDEPHADASQWRRLHIINGDANLFDYSLFLRLGTTSLVLSLAEAGLPLSVSGLALANPVAAAREISHDPTLTHRVELRNGKTATALEIQRQLREIVGAQLGPLTGEEAEIFALWGKVLDLLEFARPAAARYVEWVAKYQVLGALAARLGGDWQHPKLQALDLQWHDLRPSSSIVARLDAAGQVGRLFSAAEVRAAVERPVGTTRAAVRAAAVRSGRAFAASWTSVILDLPGDPYLRRLALPTAADGQIPPVLAQLTAQ